MAHPNNSGNAVLASPPLPADRARAQADHGPGAGGCEALLAEAHAIILGGIVRPENSDEARQTVYERAVEWRHKYGRWLG